LKKGLGELHVEHEDLNPTLILLKDLYLKDNSYLMFTPQYAQRIICLTEEGTELIYAMHQENRLVGISGFTYRPPQARKDKPKVSTFLDAKFDDIVALRPDLVVGYSDMQADLAAELIRRGIEVYIFNHHTVQGILDFVLKFSALIGNKKEGQLLLDQYKRNLEVAYNKGQQLPYSPIVFFEEWDEPIMSGSTWVMELIELCGGKLAMPELKLHFHAKNRITSPEKYMESNPDLILGSWCGKMFKPEKVKQRKGFDQITAVQHHQIFEIKSEIILQPGPAALTDGLTFLQHCIEKTARFYSEINE